MYGIYIHLHLVDFFLVNVDKYTIHGWYGLLVSTVSELFSILPTRCRTRKPSRQRWSVAAPAPYPWEDNLGRCSRLLSSSFLCMPNWLIHGGPVGSGVSWDQYWVICWYVLRVVFVFKKVNWNMLRVNPCNESQHYVQLLDKIWHVCFHCPTHFKAWLMQLKFPCMWAYY